MTKKLMSAFRGVGFLVLLAVALTAWFALDLEGRLSLEGAQAALGEWREFRGRRPVAAGAGYFAIYTAIAALSLPAAALMTLAGGALFGFWHGLLLASFASSLGAALACAAARLILRDWVQGRFAGPLRALNAGMAREGAFYLFGLRLVPLFPFFAINLAMGLLPIGLWRFYWVSQLGMLPAAAVYVNAGAQLGQLEGIEGILSPPLLAAFALLGVFPLVAKRVAGWLSAGRRGGRPGWSVYLLRCADGSFYTGVAADLARRLRQHNGELRGGARYTRSRRPVELVWSEPAAGRGAAQRREAEIRRLDRRGKQRLIAGRGLAARPGAAAGRRGSAGPTR